MPDLIQECVRVPGARNLAGELAYTSDVPRALCLLVNPHPYMGGRMDNNVIARLAAALSEANIATLRFDYSGVGASEGSQVDVTSAMADFWRTGHAVVDHQMVEDAEICLDWLRQQASAPLFVAGYSFGAYVAGCIAPSDCRGLVLISPTVGHHEFDAFLAPGVPKLVVTGDNDFATDAMTLARWLEKLPAPCAAQCIAGGQHFFRGLEDQVARTVLEFIDVQLADRSMIT